MATAEMTEKKDVPATAVKISGEVQNWDLNAKPEESRNYITINGNYGKMRKILKPRLYNVAENTGEQRAQKKAHVRKLKAAMQAGKFTPTAVYAGVTNEHEVIREKKRATINVMPECPLVLTDASHRFAALELIREQGDSARRLVDQLPITALIMLEPERTAEDFINLQEGCPVDKNHLMSMKIANNLMTEEKDKFYKMGSQIARLLHETNGTPLYKMVKFDSLGEAPIKLASLLTTNASDLATSLYGSAKIALDYGKDAEWMTGIVMMTYENIQREFPELLKQGKVLCPPPDGTKGGATMLIGVANMMAYRLKLVEREYPNEDDTKALINALEVFVDEDVNGNFSSAFKKRLMGEFCDVFFMGLANSGKVVWATHDGIPVPLITLLSASAFNATPLPKTAKKRGRKPASESTPTPTPTKESVSDNNSEAEAEDNTTIKAITADNEDSQTDPEWDDDEGETESDESAPWDDSDDDIFS